MSISSRIDKFMNEISETDELQMISFRLKTSVINQLDEYSQTLTSIAKGDEVVSRSSLIEMFIEGGVEELGKKIEERRKAEGNVTVEEDLSENRRFFLLNTNFNNSKTDHYTMLENGEASAFYGDWKKNIEYLKENDVVILYQSGHGVVGYGLADRTLERRAHEGQPNQNYTRKLNDFVRLDKPMPARKMKDVTKTNFNFMRTMVELNVKQGEALLKHFKEL